jgi:hypothetical protein
MTTLWGLELQMVGFAENTKRSKKSQALRMTALLGGLEYSWLAMLKAEKTEKSQALRRGSGRFQS